MSTTTKKFVGKVGSVIEGDSAPRTHDTHTTHHTQHKFTITITIPITSTITNTTAHTTHNTPTSRQSWCVRVHTASSYCPGVRRLRYCMLSHLPRHSGVGQLAAFSSADVPWASQAVLRASEVTLSADGVFSCNITTRSCAVRIVELSSRLGHPADGHLLVLLHQGLVVVLLIPFSVFCSGPTSIRTNRRQPTLGSENLLLSVSHLSTQRVAVAAGSVVVPPSLVLVSLRLWLGACPSVGLRGVVLLGAVLQFWKSWQRSGPVRCALVF